MVMGLIDQIKVKQTFDPDGEKGGYKFEVVHEPVPESDQTPPLGDSKCEVPSVIGGLTLERPPLTENQQEYLNGIALSESIFAQCAGLSPEDLELTGGLDTIGVFRDKHSGRFYEIAGGQRNYLPIGDVQPRKPTQGVALQGPIPEPPVKEPTGEYGPFGSFEGLIGEGLIPVPMRPVDDIESYQGYPRIPGLDVPLPERAVSENTKLMLSNEDIDRAVSEAVGDPKKWDTLTEDEIAFRGVKASRTWKDAGWGG